MVIRHGQPTRWVTRAYSAGRMRRQAWHSHVHVSVHLDSVIIDDHAEAKVCAESTLRSIIRTLARLTIYREPIREPTPADMRLSQATSSPSRERKLHIRPDVALIGDCPAIPSKQRVAGSNPARRTNRPGQGHVPILKDRAGNPTGSHRNSFPLLRPFLRLVNGNRLAAPPTTRRPGDNRAPTRRSARVTSVRR